MSRKEQRHPKLNPSKGRPDAGVQRQDDAMPTSPSAKDEVDRYIPPVTGSPSDDQDLD
jgi:hypothetical protein